LEHNPLICIHGCCSILQQKWLEFTMINFSSSLFLSLPIPVQKYFRKVLYDGCPRVSFVRLVQDGKLRTLPTSPKWYDFEAQQTISGHFTFNWNAKVRLLPLLKVQVKDSYSDGHGSGSVSLLGMKINSESDRFEMDLGSLHRLLAESVWCPTLLYPSEKLTWLPKNDLTATAILKDHGNEVQLDFLFNPEGEIIGIYSPGRWGKFGKTFQQVGWKGSFSNYISSDGLSYPSKAEVCWDSHGSWKAVWKGNVRTILFQY